MWSIKERSFTLFCVSVQINAVIGGDTIQEAAVSYYRRWYDVIAVTGILLLPSHPPNT